jgi:predicted MFS family arabinose efflux permease
MLHHRNNIRWIQKVVAVYISGEAVGALTQTFVGDRLGRIRFMQMMCIFVTIGTVIQTAAINFGMFLAGRVLAGFAVGWVGFKIPFQPTDTELTWE